MKVIKQIVSMMSKGVEVYYLTGNHDEMLRKFSDFSIGTFSLMDKLVLEIDGKKAWFFHGDVFDVTMQHSKWLAKLGGLGYDLLIVLNRAVNYISEKILHKGKISLSKKIKNSVKSAVSFISNFENTASEIAIENKYHYVVCGHIHQPVIKKIETEKGTVTYLNSGDWVENLTALEYHNKTWSLYTFNPQELPQENILENIEQEIQLEEVFIKESIEKLIS
jgi:UDP-2,3-diacylglucosamine pyrophosphatase LpxH